MAKCTETELQVLLKNATKDRGGKPSTCRDVTLVMSREEYRRLVAGIDQLAAANREIERLRSEMTNAQLHNAFE